MFTSASACSASSRARRSACRSEAARSIPSSGMGRSLHRALLFGARVPRPRARAASSGLSSRRSVPDSASAPLANRGDAGRILDELRWFPAGIPTLVRQDFPRQLAELLMHQRREDRKRVRISVAPRPKKTGEIRLFRHVRWILPPGRAEGCGCRIGLVVARESAA